MSDRRRFSDLAVEPLANGRDWRLLKPLTFGGLEVPVGFVTDFASVPRALWWLYPPFGKYGKAAVLHDFLYRDPARRREGSRAEADAVFLAGMAALGVPAARRWVIYLSLRLFGGIAWRANGRKRRP